MSTPPEQMQSQQAPTVRLPKRLPLVQPYSSRNQSILKDARLVNCYAEQSPDGGWEVEKRPGLKGVLATGATSLLDLGFYCFTGWGFYAATTAFGVASLYTIELTSFTVAATTSINDTGGTYCFIAAPTSLTEGMVYLGNSTTGYTLSFNTIPATLTKITDTNFPTSLCFGAAVLDGSLYVMASNGLIYGSNQDDPTTWNALNTIAANADADLPIALAGHLTYVVALKQWTTNFFWDAGNATGSPLSPVPDSQVPYGCLAGETIQELDGNLIWVTTGKNVAPQIGRLNNLSFSIVSTPAVDRLLQPGGSPNEWKSWTLKSAGHRFYGVTNYVQGYTLVYDLDTNLWQIWTDATGNLVFPISWMSDQTYSAYQNYSLGVYNGYVYSIQPDYAVSVDSIGAANAFTTTAIPVDIYTPSYDAGTRRPKTLDCMFFNTDKTAGSILKARWNDSDYQTTKWSNFRKIDLARKRPMLTDNGTFSRRAYHFRHQCPTPFRISSIDLQMDLGTG